MKNVIFLRHAKLNPPFQDYEKLTFQDFSKLARGETQPGIELLSNDIMEQVIQKYKLENVQEILSSPSLRAVMTARKLAETLQLTTIIKERRFLSEIYFDPDILTTERQFQQEGLMAIRTQIYQSSLSEGRGVESFASVLKRVNDLTRTIHELSSENILCITHSFYMRVLIQILLEHKTPVNIRHEDLFNTVNYSYLEGFQVYVN